MRPLLPISRPIRITFVEDFGEAAHDRNHGGRFVNSATLEPVARKGYWRVKMTWPNRHHFFGKFLSQAEAEKWIEQHRWLAENVRSDCEISRTTVE
jgi:hypothetical protein